MDEEHVRNALRMILRHRRRAAVRVALRRAFDEECFGDGQALLNDQARQDLRNPNVYFPLLGCHGSEELYKTHAGRI